MSFFVDANVVVYAAVESEYREPCLRVLAAVAGRHAEGRTSTAVLEEIWHLELSGRAGPLEGLARSAYAVFTPLLSVVDEAVELALSLDGGRLCANDRIHVATAIKNGLDTIVSADAGFDDVPHLRRVDPLDAVALAVLVGA